ncbi:MAG TPA: hypothetical protein VGF98_02340 [Candidatus Tumulicola sp.]|jgi:hypothetical protein
MKPNWTLLATTYVIRQTYLKFKIRVRQWGRLPADRGATVLITNHQHMDEGEMITARTFLLHPWKPLVMCNSRRTFETGFIAARLPFTARFTRGMNLSWLWDCLSVLPVENHLFSRPLISLAEELQAAHGDLTIDEILPAETVAELGLHGVTLSGLWKLENFSKAQAWMKIARLKPPYRHEVLVNLRAVNERDIAAIVERVRGGATFYITPEGDFSRDGRLHSMRNGIVGALAPFADLWICAVAYDPFRTGRLSMLYRTIRHDGIADLGVSVAAARPITNSALLATFLCDAPETFGAEDAIRAVRAQLNALPGNVFVDPEVIGAPDGIVANALTALVKSGTLTLEGGRYRLTAHRSDPKFPHVPDMIAFQRNMLDETLASAQQLERPA